MKKEAVSGGKRNLFGAFVPKTARLALRAEKGAATVEFALTIPAIVLLLLFILAAFLGGAAKMQACSNARDLARAYALAQENQLSEEKSHDSLTVLKAHLAARGVQHRVQMVNGLVQVEAQVKGVRLFPSITCQMNVIDEGS